MNGHINETAPPLVSIGEVKLVQVQIVVWFVRTCEVWILFVLLAQIRFSLLSFYMITLVSYIIGLITLQHRSAVCLFAHTFFSSIVHTT